MSISRSSFVAFVLLPVLTAGILIAGVQYRDAAARRSLLNQFQQRTAPDNAAILKDDVILREYARTYGPAPTMRVIVAAAARAGIDCHNRAHQFGRISYEEFGDELLKLNLPECHSGFYHGAIEAYFKKNGTNDLQRKLSFICPDDLNVFFMHQCHHGLGHGLMAWSSYELLESLEYCNYLEADSARASCRTGIFMENIVGSLADSEEARALGHFSTYLSDDPQYPCNIVKDEYKADCYYLQTDRMLMLSGNNFESVVDGCAAAPEPYRYSCFSSFGRTIGGATRGRLADGLKACELVDDRTYRIACIQTLAKDQLWDPSGVELAVTLCDLVLEDGGRRECYEALLSQAADVLSTEQLRTFCSSAPADLQATCLAGPSR